MAASMENVYTSVFQAHTTDNSTLAEIKDLTDTFQENQLLTGKWVKPLPDDKILDCSKSKEAAANSLKLMKFISSPEHEVLKSTSNLQEILSYVHDSLTKTKERPKGLQLLKVVVSQSSTDVFQHNAERWIRLLLQILQGHSEVEVYRASLQVLGDIFEHAKNFTDVSRTIVNSTFQELVPILLKPFSPKVLTDNIVCINRCIKTFPGPLGPHKGKIEALVYGELSSNTKSKTVYKCFALLNQCGPGGTKGIKHTENWCKQCSEVLGSLEITIGSLYDGFETDKLDTSDEKDCLPLTKTSNPLETNLISSIKSRWITLCGCLEALLGIEIEATVRVPVDRIVQLICRALAVNCNMVLSKPTTERMLLASYLTEIHRASLSVLEQLIVTCRKNLLPYCTVITGLLSQELLWSKSSNIGYHMTFSILRQKVYTVMSILMRVLDGCSAVNQESKIWVEEILHDCAPYAESFTLNTSLSKSTKQDDRPKKKKKQGYHEISQGISTQKKIHADANCRLVQAGLEALYWLITTFGPQMDRKSLQAVLSFIIKTLLTIQQTVEKQSPIPYSKPACRKSLYRVLLACVVNTHPKAPPPTQCALRIFSNGQIDKNLEVSSFCLEALRICEVLIHPRAPVLNGPIICDNIIRIGNESSLIDKTQAVDNDIIGESEICSDINSNNKGLLKRPLSSDENISNTGIAKVMKLQSEVDNRIDKSKYNDKDNIEDSEIHILCKTGKIEESEENIAKRIQNTKASSDKKSPKRHEGKMEAMEILDSESENEDIDDDNDDDGENDSEDESGDIKEREGKQDSESCTSVDDEIGPSGDTEVYIATKCDIGGDGPVENIEDDENDSKTEFDEIEDDEENKDEEVATMMLTFVDASPDSD